MLALCLSFFFCFSSQVLAQISPQKQAAQITKDGREYAKLTEKEVDELSDEEYDKFRKWEKSQLNAKLLSTAQLADKE